MSVFSRAQEEALRELIALWGPDRIVLIGGAALAALTGMPWRTTLDIDLVVAGGPEASARDLSSLADWTKDPDHEPRWVYRGEVPIDVVPVTPEILRAGRLRWPRSQAVMNTAGLELAGRLAVTIKLSDGTALRVAPLPVITVLKMASFLDRPHDRTHDLGDIAWTMDAFLSDVDERRFDGRLIDLDIQYDEGSAFALGEAIRGLAGPAHVTLVKRFLSDAEASWLDSLAVQGPPSWGRSPEGARRRLRAFRFGLEPRGSP